ncbi:hypothetical protein LENED_010017 [Lentinula edodes]|uniref:Uncharacterized protein n=1 Tax=Lentinula edodes TaxID=5353 RepID=A0A1Q3EL90_LENED|nr:hypothetical protein LENED_010017 [Lentinula edodes]
MGWQRTFSLGRRSKGCHLITDEVTSQIEAGLKDVQVGMLFLFVKHTSCALTLNENWDPDVRKDMDMALDCVVPESLDWLHTDEGPENDGSFQRHYLMQVYIHQRFSYQIVFGRIDYIYTYNQRVTQSRNLARNLSDGIPTPSSHENRRSNHPILISQHGSEFMKGCSLQRAHKADQLFVETRHVAPVVKGGI